MLSDLHNSVLAIEDHHSGRPLGTGVVLSPVVLLTCAHLFTGYQKENIGSGRTRLPATVRVLCGDASLQPSHIRLSQSLDLCCIYFDAMLGGMPIRLARSFRLQGIPVTVTGFVPEEERSRRSVTRELEVIHNLQSEESGYLQYAQLRGGLPAGLSGGPVLLKVKNDWLMVGMLQLGQETSTTSRFMGVDPIAAFLRKQGVCLPVTCLSQQQTVKKKPAVSPSSRAQLDNSIIISGRTTIGGSITNQITHGDCSGATRDFEDSQDEL